MGQPRFFIQWQTARSCCLDCDACINYKGRERRKRHDTFVGHASLDGIPAIPKGYARPSDDINGYCLECYPPENTNLLRRLHRSVTFERGESTDNKHYLHFHPFRRSADHVGLGLSCNSSSGASLILGKVEWSLYCHDHIRTICT